jgi:hypothetical protein
VLLVLLVVLLLLLLLLVLLLVLLLLLVLCFSRQLLSNQPLMHAGTSTGAHPAPGPLSIYCTGAACCTSRCSSCPRLSRGPLALCPQR